jgi:hypothetical protein
MTDMVQFAPKNEAQTMPSTTSRESVYLTADQRERARELMTAAGCKSFSEYARYLMAQECADQGIEWPDDANQWGGLRDRPRKSGG